VCNLDEPDSQRSLKLIVKIGTPRANIAASFEAPNGTQQGDWAEKRKNMTVLQQHCYFFDSDLDGIIWPLDTYRGFHALGFNMFLSVIAVFIIHANFSYPTGTSYLPDPFFRIHTERVHKDKHGSDSGSYDNEGRFVPQKFEDIFAKYAGSEKGTGKDAITFPEVISMLNGTRAIGDVIGAGGAIFEWLATYILLWPEDGRMKKEDIRRIYDGSIFYELAARRSKQGL